MSRRTAFAAIVTVLAMTSFARAQLIYQVETLAAGSAHEIFNNSVGTETEDCWVANSFTVVAGGTRINSLTFLAGNALTGQQVTVALYTGTSLTNPSGLIRNVPSTNTATVTVAANAFAEVPFAAPIDLPVGQIFYAALLIRGVPGTLFPFSSDAQSTTPPPPAGRSFFDVGQTIGGAYNLDMTQNATVLGGTHPVLMGVAQSAGNLAVRVNASPIPEPTSLALAGVGLTGLVLRRWRRSR